MLTHIQINFISIKWVTCSNIETPQINVMMCLSSNLKGLSKNIVSFMAIKLQRFAYFLIEVTILLIK